MRDVFAKVEGRRHAVDTLAYCMNVSGLCTQACAVGSSVGSPVGSPVAAAPLVPAAAIAPMREFEVS